ncbi:hypothetical protein [uncultured Methylobacterium sp.]|uniref:hypothetical protein n=1 Tax=uncultured Methylobacterium sp. TaxID=157278 RepID=UPI0035CC620A
MMPAPQRPALRIVDAPRASTPTWYVAHADGSIGLEIDGFVVCLLTPAAVDAAGAILKWEAFSFRAWRTRIVEPASLAEACAAAAAWFRVPAPEASFIAGHVDRLAPAVKPSTDRTALVERLADLLAAILDDPMTTLPGAGPDGGPPLELRLSHFRPELCERAARLLDEAGR